MHLPTTASFPLISEVGGKSFGIIPCSCRACKENISDCSERAYKRGLKLTFISPAHLTSKHLSYQPFRTSTCQKNPYSHIYYQICISYLLLYSFILILYPIHSNFKVGKSLFMKHNQPNWLVI